eukprot:11359416-Heterocapsa_arctica.AAC.1
MSIHFHTTRAKRQAGDRLLAHNAGHGDLVDNTRGLALVAGRPAALPGAGRLPCLAGELAWLAGWLAGRLADLAGWLAG